MKIDVSIANAIRRIILSEIPCVVIDSLDKQNVEDQKIIINKNNTLLNNEIIKQRLSCIPVCLDYIECIQDNNPDSLELLINKYNEFINNKKIKIDVRNDQNNKICVTSGDIKIIDKKDDNEDKEETEKCFKKCALSDQFIDIVYLEPKYELIGKYEHLMLESEFKIGYAYENGAYNVASTCVFTNTIDEIRAEQALKEKMNSIENSQDITDKTEKDELLEVERNDFNNLDRKRIYIPNSFDFKVNSIGIYENKDLVKIACFVMMDKLNKFKSNIESGNNVEITQNYGFTDNCFDIRIEHEDYT